MVQLTDDMIEMLDAEARRQGLSRSAVIRNAVDAYLADSRERAVARQLVDAYTAVPQGATDGWGDVTELGRESARRTLSRLDDEEEAAGLTW